MKRAGSKISKRSKMYLKCLVLIFATIAIAAGDSIPTKLNSITGKMERVSYGMSEFNLFAAGLIKYLVLFNTKVNGLEGTGYIVTLNTMITPTENLNNFRSGIQFEISKALSRLTHTMDARKKHDKFLSIAHFQPAIEERKRDLIPRIPIKPISQVNPTYTTVMVVGFTRNGRKSRTLVSDFSKRERIYSTSHLLDNTNFNDTYKPRIGDVLVMNGFILGILTDYRRVLDHVTSDFHTFQYLSESENTEPLNTEQCESSMVNL